MRRRKKNSLLPKMIGIAVLVNAILLPILSQLGVFKAMHGRHLEDVKLVTLPPEKKPPTPKHEPPKKHVAKAKPRPASHTPSRNVASRPSRPNPNQPKVVASSGGAGDNGGPVIDNNGTGNAGAVPTSPTPAAPTPEPPPTAPPVTPPVTPPPPVTPTLPPPPVTPPPPPPHIPVVAEAEPTSQPKPQIPDDLSYDDIHGNFEALFTIQADGTTSVKMVSSTGNSRLDNLALDAARHWTFHPGTVDGKPVDSFRRLTVEFYAT